MYEWMEKEFFLGGGGILASWSERASEREN